MGKTVKDLHPVDRFAIANLEFEARLCEAVHNDLLLVLDRHAPYHVNETADQLRKAASDYKNELGVTDG